MTLGGFLREIETAQRRAARDAERRQRMLARAAKLQAKISEIERAAAEAEAYNDQILHLTTVHHAVGEAMEWAELAARPAPHVPAKLNRFEAAAIQARDSFKPTLWQRLLGKEAKLRATLEAAVAEGRSRDEVSHQGALKLHNQQLENWQQLKTLAKAILAGDTSSYRTALEELNPLGELLDMGCELEIGFPDARTAEVDLKVESKRVVPAEAKSVTKLGKLSVKPLPEGKIQELYQDYVCGCALRTAREFFSFLPLTRVAVSARTSLLDSATGHLRDQVILSVAMPRSTLETMVFESVDPSDSLELFPHRMGFKRSQGFSAVAPLQRSEYPVE